ncbi:MAG: DUF4129 domain-containing protein [Spartobacteria bacterium]
MKNRPTRDRPTLDLMEEAVHLVRSAPLDYFAWYWLGALPFLLSLLYFWTDMSWSAVAAQHRVEASLGVAVLFLWMKSCQSVFCHKLRRRLARQADQPVGLGEFVSLVLNQAILQPGKLFLLPAAALATIPFGWVWAFYENVTVLGGSQNIRELFRRARRQAAFWPRQNHGVILIYLLLLGVVFFNLAIVVFLLPHLLRIFTGVESTFTQSPQSFLNTTSLAVTCCLTYLVCDPLLKAIYTLRCFEGDSLRSGEDLIAELRGLPRLGPIVALLMAACLWVTPPAVAEVAASAGRATNAIEMNRAIEETVKQPRFSWRLPRQAETPALKRKWPFADAIGRFLKATGRLFGRAFRALGRWLDQLFSRRLPPAPDIPSNAGWQTTSRGWFTALLILLGGLTLSLVVQTVRQFHLRRSREFTALPVAPTPDLADENVSADLLPEDDWLRLAREHLNTGELRLALRAFFFAGLAHLQAREVLTLARHKSNRDYRRELQRKASDQPPVLAAFEQNVAAVERVWYGRHAIDHDALERFTANLEEIRKC